MAFRIGGWFGLISVIVIGLFGFGWYLTILSFLVSFLAGILTILYFNYDDKKIFNVDINCLDDPLQQTNYSIQSPKILEIFKTDKPLPKFDQRITGSDTVDSFLNEIITIIINDYVTPWYGILTDDEEFTNHSIKKLVISASANVANRVKSVDWIHLLSTKFPEEFTMHLRLFKQSRVRLKHIDLVTAKEVNGNGKPSPKKEEKKTHRRNKSDTDLSWLPDTQTFGKSKFYDSSEDVSGKSLIDLFFDLENSIENRQVCRDIFCTDPDKEYALLCEVSEAVIYLVAPEEVWRCHALKLLLVDLLSSVVLRPVMELLSDPDNINRAIIRTCCRDSCLPSEQFLMVIRCCGDAEELDATLEMVQKDIQKLHSRDTAGEWDMQDRQKLSSLQYLSRIIQARRATLGPQGSSTTEEKVSEEVIRSLKFLHDITAWKDKAQYLLDIELNETDSAQTSKVVIDNLRSSALEICDTYLTPNRVLVLGIPENCHSDLVRKINTEGEEFTNNPVIFFEEVKKCVSFAVEDDPSWQSVLTMEDQDGALNSETKKEDKDTKKYSARTDKCRKLMRSCLNTLPKLFHKVNKSQWVDKASTFPRDVARKAPIDRSHTLPKCKFGKCKKLMRSCLNTLPKLFHKVNKPQWVDKASTFPRDVARKAPMDRSHTLPKCKFGLDTLPVPGARHNRSRSDIVGNLAQKMISESAGPSNLMSANTNNISLSHSNISQNAKNLTSPLQASIIETALMQDKGKAIGIYAIAVTRVSDNEKWHIYRRYSDFYDLHSSIKDKWPELGHLPFPAKKTFQNTSRAVLETRKRMLNNYLMNLVNLAREARYMALWSQDYLGGFLSQEIQTGKQSNSFDALFVNSIRAGVRTLKNMPDQFANTVDGVMDGISKVFQSKGSDSCEDLRYGSSSDCQDEGDESAALRLLEEVLGVRGLWLRRKLLAPLRTLIGDRVDKKVLELVSSLTSPRNVVQYLKTFKQWLTSRNNSLASNRDAATKARTRVAAKVALLAASSDELKHIAGSDAARRGLLTVFDLFQNEEINKRLIFVLLEAALANLFPDNEFPELFKKLYSNSPRVPTTKKC